jgi:hypothetical protein
MSKLEHIGALKIQIIDKVRTRDNLYILVFTQMFRHQYYRDILQSSKYL